MCGIWGRIGEKRTVISINKKLESMRNRGPDSTSTLEADWFDAGMVRLAINGLMDGDQPFHDVSGRYLVFYNGEIYNYPDLRELLASSGIEFLEEFRCPQVNYFVIIVGVCHPDLTAWSAIDLGIRNSLC